MLKLEIYKFENKNKKIFNYPRPSYFNSNIIILKLIHNDEHSSLGEVNSYSGSFIEIINNLKIIFSQIKQYDLKKKNLINLLNLKIPVTNNFCFNSCVAGFMQALVGLKSKIENKKVINFFTNRKIKINNIINVYASGGMVFKGQDNKLIEEANFCKQNKYFGYKFRPPYPKQFNHHNMRFKKPDFFDIKKFLKMSEKIRVSVGKEFNLMADLGCRITSKSDLNYLMNGLNELNFFFVEEPIIRNLSLYDNIENYKNIASGEHLHNLNETKKWISCKNVKFFQFDPNSLSMNYILSLYKKLKSKKKIYIPHNWTTPVNTSVGINLLLIFQQKINLIERNFYTSPYNDLFINKSFYFNDGRFILVNNKGFGIRLNSNYFDKFNLELVRFI